MKFKNYLALIFLFFCFACSEKESTQEKKASTESNSENALAKNEKKETDTLLLVTQKYHYDSGNLNITLSEYTQNNGKLTSTQRDLDLGKYKDMLTNGIYQSTGAYYPVQFDIASNKAYISITNADMLDGTFNYCKILSYDLKSNLVEEIATFQHPFDSWYLSTSNKKIYGINREDNSILMIDIASTKVSKLYDVGYMLGETKYDLQESQPLDMMIFNDEKGVVKYSIDLATNEVSKTPLISVKSFSSYNKGIIIETYNDSDKGIEEIRVYNGLDKKAISYDFNNYRTHWVSDSEFVVTKKDEIQKLNTNLEVIKKLALQRIHVIDVINSFILISYFEGEKEKVALVDFELENIIEIPNTEAHEIVLVTDK